MKDRSQEGRHPRSAAAAPQPREPIIVAQPHADSILRLFDSGIPPQPTFAERQAIQLGFALCHVPGPWGHPWHSRWTTHYNSAAAEITPENYGHALQHLLSRSRDVQAAAQEIDAALHTDAAPGALFLAFFGPIIRDDGHDEAGVDGTLRLNEAFPHPGRDPVKQPAVSACVSLRYSIPRPFRPGNAKDVKLAEDEDLHDLGRDVLLRARQVEGILAVSRYPEPLVVVEARFMFEDEVARRLCSSVLLHNMPYLRSPPNRTCPLSVIDAGVIRSRWESLRAIQANERSHGMSLTIACERLHRGVIQPREQDALIEACISLEAMFGDGSAEGATYKVVKRCARFLGTTIEERTAIDKQLKDAIALRGKIVHGRDFGIVLKDTVDGVLELAARAARKILDSRKWPTLVELDYG